MSLKSQKRRRYRSSLDCDVHQAAAREMKERIQVASQKAMNEEQDPERSRHFSRQIALCQQPISARYMPFV